MLIIQPEGGGVRLYVLIIISEIMPQRRTYLFVHFDVETVRHLVVLQQKETKVFSDRRLSFTYEARSKHRTTRQGIKWRKGEREREREREREEHESED